MMESNKYLKVKERQISEVISMVKGNSGFSPVNKLVFFERKI
jgi:hypothetical protein